MSKTIGTIAIVIIAGLIYYFYAPDSWKFWVKTADSADSTLEEPTASTHERITAKHQYKNGTHIIAGEANSPTACDVLTTEAVTAESMPEQVTINFVSKTEGEVCAQVVTSNRFKIDFKASENATIKATWNGKPVQLNLVPVGADEDLVNFELFIKG